MKPDSILTKFRVLPRRNIYQLGCTAQLLNVHSQQHRAFNLIWALSEKGKLTAGTKTAVVGAGVAGIAASIAAAACGANVRIYDSKKTVMHLQRGNDTRFLHPNIALWPAKSFGYPLTDLPFFNWRAETAGAVISQVNRQWEAASAIFAPQIDDQYLGTPVKEVGIAPSGEIFIRTGTSNEHYEVVILAVGYGLEKALPSYWRNDDLAQPVLGQSERRTYFVSGAGDGGLTEVLRLTIKDFQHQRFIQTVMRDSWLINKAKTLARTGQWQAFLSTEMHRKKPTFLALKREDTAVSFGANSSFQSSKAQLLHKICVALLMRHHPDTVKYVEGLLTVSKRKDIKCVKICRNGAFRRISVDSLVDRRGTNQVLAHLFPNETNLIKRLRAKWQGNDPTARPQYSVGFLADELKTSHLEDRYQIGFLLRAAGDKQRIADEIFEKLGFNLPANIQLWLNQIITNTSPPITSPAGKQFSLSVQDSVITIFGGDDPQNYQQGAQAAPSGSWRIFASAQELAIHTKFQNPAATCLFFNTSSRYLVEKLLASDRLPYQVYRVFLSDSFETYLTANFPGGRPDRFVNFDTERFLISRDDLPIPSKYFEVHTTGDMLATHWLLRAPTMLEILMHRWPTTKVGGMGWAIGGTRNGLRNQQDGNRLLEWNPL